MSEFESLFETIFDFLKTPFGDFLILALTLLIIISAFRFVFCLVVDFPREPDFFSRRFSWLWKKVLQPCFRYLNKTIFTPCFRYLKRKFIEYLES